MRWLPLRTSSVNCERTPSPIGSGPGVFAIDKKGRRGDSGCSIEGARSRTLEPDVVQVQLLQLGEGRYVGLNCTAELVPVEVERLQGRRERREQPDRFVKWWS